MVGLFELMMRDYTFNCSPFHERLERARSTDPAEALPLTRLVLEVSASVNPLLESRSRVGCILYASDTTIIQKYWKIHEPKPSHAGCEFRKIVKKDIEHSRKFSETKKSLFHMSATKTTFLKFSKSKLSRIQGNYRKHVSEMLLRAKHFWFRDFPIFLDKCCCVEKS